MREAPVTPGTASPAVRAFVNDLMIGGGPRRGALAELERHGEPQDPSVSVHDVVRSLVEIIDRLAQRAPSPASETATIAQDASEAEQITKSLEGAADHWEREVETLYGDAKP